MVPQSFHSDKSQAFNASSTASFPLRIPGSGHVARSQAKEFRARLRSFNLHLHCGLKIRQAVADNFSFEEYVCAGDVNIGEIRVAQERRVIIGNWLYRARLAERKCPRDSCTRRRTPDLVP